MEYIQSNKDNKETGSNTIKNVGKLLLTLTGSVALGLTLISAPFISPALRKFCLPYIPATTKQVNNVLLALRKCNGTTVIDLGSGDGRIVIEAAKCGYTAYGVELNPWLVLFSKLNSLRQGTIQRTKFCRRDLWKVNLRNYDNIVIFGVEQMMADLEKKITNECTGTCNVIACRFPLPSTRPMVTIGTGVDQVWLYDMKRTQRLTEI